MVKAPAIELDRFAPALVAGAILALATSLGDLGPAPRTLGVICLGGSLATAVIPKQRAVRAHGSVALAAAAVTAAGQSQLGLTFAGAALAFVLVATRTMRAARRRGEDPKAEAHRNPRAVAVIGVVAAAITGLLAFSMPRAAAIVERKIRHWAEGMSFADETGFSSVLRLGSTTGMLESDKIVLRIEGERPEYLRGAVHDLYERGGAWGHRWSSTLDQPTLQEAAAIGPREVAETRIVFARGAPLARGREARFFTPADACDIGTPIGTVLIDGAGVVHPKGNRAGDSIWFRTRNCSTPPIPITPARRVDLEVPPRLRATLGPIAESYVLGANDDREKLDAIVRRLSDLTYSLHVERDPKLDPIVDFLTVHRAGHCEMFASAMTLLARSAGIPARVVTGYHVTEENLVGGYAVVRERNAHAWVEAWVDGRWRVYDPTPLSEGTMRKTGTASQVFDAVAYALDRGVTAVLNLGPLGVALVLGVVLLLLVAFREIERIVRARVSRRLRRRGSGGDPLPSFDALTAALSRAGHERDESEPIERFARRLAGLPDVWATEVADAIAGYARLRYGNEGDERAVTKLLEHAARRITSSA